MERHFGLVVCQGIPGDLSGKLLILRISDWNTVILPGKVSGLLTGWKVIHSLPEVVHVLMMSRSALWGGWNPYTATCQAHPWQHRWCQVWPV